MADKSEALTTLAGDWRHLLFPQATDAQFADGYAQAVTFGPSERKRKQTTRKAPPVPDPRATRLDGF